ncbi:MULTISPECIES: hypothetical protein [Leuconostoc]|uniref:hypothetical protein n=1 Tax=Leuconostoc TaxID=1243 RepID=UPI0032DE7944
MVNSDKIFFCNQLAEYLLQESNYKLENDVAHSIAKSISESIDFTNQYEVHKSIRQRALDILPSVKKEYFIA